MDEFSKYLDLFEELAKSTLDTVSKFRSGMPVSNSRSKRTYKFEYVESILRNAGKPLHINEIIEIAKRDYKAEIHEILNRILLVLNRGNSCNFFKDSEKVAFIGITYFFYNIIYLETAICKHFLCLFYTYVINIVSE